MWPTACIKSTQLPSAYAVQIVRENPQAQLLTPSKPEGGEAVHICAAVRTKGARPPSQLATPESNETRGGCSAHLRCCMLGLPYMPHNTTAKRICFAEMFYNIASLLSTFEMPLTELLKTQNHPTHCAHAGSLKHRLHRGQGTSGQCAIMVWISLI